VQARLVSIRLCRLTIELTSSIGPLNMADIAPNLAGLTPVYFALHLAGGHVGLPILVLTFLLSKEVQRHPVIINFCITWMIYSISFCLLIYGGHNQTENPPSVLCIMQSAFLYGAPTMAVTALLLVVIQVGV